MRGLSCSGILHTLRANLRSRSSSAALEHLGCSLFELRKHLEAQFASGMSWSNYGSHGWHIDHVVPLSSTDDFYERLKLHHYTNLRPLWAKHNMQKGAKTGWEQDTNAQAGAAARTIETLRVNTGEGQPFSAKLARKLGVSSALLSHHEKRGNLLRLGRGFFMFPGEKLDAAHAITLLAEGIPDLHIGAEAALLWHARKSSEIFDGNLVVVAQSRKGLPEWFTSRCSVAYVGRSPFAKGARSYAAAIQKNVAALRGAACAEPELALLEVLYDVGLRLSVDRAREVISQAQSVDVSKLNSLLKATDSVKVQKLAALWPQQLALPWAHELMSGNWKPLSASKRWSRKLADGSRLHLPPMKASRSA